MCRYPLVKQTAGHSFPVVRLCLSLLHVGETATQFHYRRRGRSGLGTVKMYYKLCSCLNHHRNCSKFWSPIGPRQFVMAVSGRLFTNGLSCRWGRLPIALSSVVKQLRVPCSQLHNGSPLATTTSSYGYWEPGQFNPKKAVILTQGSQKVVISIYPYR